MRSFKFNLGVPGEGETPIASINLYESADGFTGWILIDSIAIGALADDNGKKLWAVPTADPTQYAKLVTVNDSGLESPNGSVLPPVPAAEGTFRIFCWVVDLGLTAIAGIEMTAQPASGARFKKPGDRLAIKQLDKYSNTEGYVEMDLPSDIGLLTITVAGNSGNIDTTGKSGGAVNFTSLL